MISKYLFMLSSRAGHPWVNFNLNWVGLWSSIKETLTSVIYFKGSSFLSEIEIYFKSFKVQILKGLAVSLSFEQFIAQLGGSKELSATTGQL